MSPSQWAQLLPGKRRKEHLLVFSLLHLIPCVYTAGIADVRPFILRVIQTSRLGSIIYSKSRVCVHRFWVSQRNSQRMWEETI